MGSNITNWNEWCQNLWATNSEAWSKRSGQDHFYRQVVVIPALVQAIKDKHFVSLVDIGSGDGHNTNVLLEAFYQLGKTFNPVMLIDQSIEQLKQAKLKPRLSQAITQVRNLVNDDWARDIGDLPSPRLLLSIFVLQEIPQVSKFFSILSRGMSAGDEFAAVIVHPDYSEKLRQDSKLEVAAVGTANDEWEFAAEYPIGTDGETFYLPHFQRGLQAYSEIAKESGLNLVSHINLQAPNNHESKQIFASTVYGEDILLTPSSVLIMFKKAS